MNLILIVGQNGTDIGMRKDVDPFFGTLVPNYIGNDMELVTASYSDGVDFILKPASGTQIDGTTEFTLTSESGASITLAWDAVDNHYSGLIGALAPVLASHLNGVLNLSLVVLSVVKAIVTDPNFNNMNKSDLINYAKEHDIDISMARTNADRVAILEGV